MGSREMKPERIVTTNTKIKQILGLMDTPDVNDFEQGFLESMERMTDSGKNCEHLSDRQRDVIDNIWKKHFA